MTKRFADAPYTPEAAPMEQVRELLFGAQLKDMETRFQRQEERFLREIADSRDALKKRLDSLENFMKSETTSLLHRIKEEQTERDSILRNEQHERQEGLKSEQRERAESIKNEQRERAEAIKNEQRERGEALTQLAKELAGTAEAFDRKIGKVSSTLDTAERELRQLLLSEGGSLSDKIEEKYQEALAVLANTAEQIRHDMVPRSSLSSMFTEVAVKLSGQWTPEVGHMIMHAEAASEAPRRSREAQAEQASGNADD